MFNKVLTAAILSGIVFGSFATRAQADDDGSKPRTKTVVVPYVDPSFSPPVKLGIMGRATNRGILVDRTMYDSPAERLGLERGDIIMKINGVSVRSLSHLKRLLQDAADNNYGHISVLIDNVRARNGDWTAERYVLAETELDVSHHLYSEQGSEPVSQEVPY